MDNNPTPTEPVNQPIDPAPVQPAPAELIEAPVETPAPEPQEPATAAT